MSGSTSRRLAGLATALALTGAFTAQAAATDDGPRPTPRLLFATTDQNQLLQLDSGRPGRIRDVRAITGLPSGVSLKGIDFRPQTGDLYGVGSDSVVYRVNPFTGIAIAEGPAFAPGLRGAAFGVDFNPTVDKIRVVSDAAQNLRLNPDEGTVLNSDRDLNPMNPGMPRVVGAAYTGSSFSATRPAATTLYVVDAASDQLFVQAPPNDGTLTMPKRLGIDPQDVTGFDIAGRDDQGYLVTTGLRGWGSALYLVDVKTGATRFAGRIGGRSTVLTGLAALQDR